MGKVRDLVVAIRSETSQPRVLGLVVEVLGRRRIFVPMTRVTHIDSGQVNTTGLLNMRRFEQRPTETLVIGEMLDRTVTIEPTGVTRHRLRRRDGAGPHPRLGAQPGRGAGARARACGAGARPTSWSGATSSAWSRREPTQGATHLLAALNEMRAADAASVLHDLPPERRAAVVAALDDERLADVLEELPEEDQVEILGYLGSERAADVLEEMSPDDAADLIAELPPETAATLLEPDGARRGRGRPPPDVLRRGDRRRHDDARAGDPRPRRDRRRGPGPDPQRRARRSSLAARSTSAGRRWRPRPAGSSASRTSSACCASRPRRWSPAVLDHDHGPAAPRGHARRGRAPTSPPTTWSRRRSSTTPGTCSARSPSTTCSTTCSRRTGATSPLGDRDPAGGEPWLSAASGRARHPQGAASPAAARPRRYDTDAFGVFAEQFARFMGTARFLMWMTVFVVVWVGWNTLAPERPAVRPLPVHLPDPDPQPAGVVRRAADPARAEPPGGPRPGDRRAGPPGQRARPRRHGVPRPRGRLAADGRRRGRDPRLPALGAARAARRAGRADEDERRGGRRRA